MALKQSLDVTRRRENMQDQHVTIGQDAAPLAPRHLLRRKSGAAALLHFLG